MKKIIITAAMLVLSAPLAKATDLYIKNETNQSISLAIQGHPKHMDSINAYVLNPGKRTKFFTWGKLSGPLRFCWTKDINKKKFAFYETSHYFPVKTASIKGLSIKMTSRKDDTGKPVPGIQQTWPKTSTLTNHPIRAFTVKKAMPIKSATGETVMW